MKVLIQSSIRVNLVTRFSPSLSCLALLSLSLSSFPMLLLFTRTTILFDYSSLFLMRHKSISCRATFDFPAPLLLSVPRLHTGRSLSFTERQNSKRQEKSCHFDVVSVSGGEKADLFFLPTHDRLVYLFFIPLLAILCYQIDESTAKAKKKRQEKRVQTQEKKEQKKSGRESTGEDKRKKGFSIQRV